MNPENSGLENESRDSRLPSFPTDPVRRPAQSLISPSYSPSTINSDPSSASRQAQSLRLPSSSAPAPIEPLFGRSDTGSSRLSSSSAPIDPSSVRSDTGSLRLPSTPIDPLFGRSNTGSLSNPTINDQILSRAPSSMRSQPEFTARSPSSSYQSIGSVRSENIPSQSRSSTGFKPQSRPILPPTITTGKLPDRIKTIKQDFLKTFLFSTSVKTLEETIIPPELEGDEIFKKFASHLKKITSIFSTALPNHSESLINELSNLDFHNYKIIDQAENLYRSLESQNQLLENINERIIAKGNTANNGEIVDLWNNLKENFTRLTLFSIIRKIDMNNCDDILADLIKLTNHQYNSIISMHEEELVGSTGLQPPEESRNKYLKYKNKYLKFKNNKVN